MQREIGEIIYEIMVVSLDNVKLSIGLIATIARSYISCGGIGVDRTVYVRRSGACDKFYR
jgi:hypothetical protein